jgi:arylsulfatase A-like enzyme
MRKYLIKSTMVAVGVSQMACNTPATQRSNIITDRPNIIIINSDDLGWADLACYGNTIHETPNIDAFAKESVRFTDFYAAAPICSPTRASIMTGKYPARLHFTTWSEAAKGLYTDLSKGKKLIEATSIADLPLEEVTIAEALKTKGYNTIHIGKWHLGESLYYPENQGFDINIGGGSWGCPSYYFYPYRDPENEVHRYIPGLERSGTGGNHYLENREGEYLTDRLTDEAITVMKDAVSTDTPFFMNLCYYAVHTPIEAPDSIVKYYSDKISKAGKDCNPTYAAMVHMVDQNVGRVLKTIKELGIFDNTMVIFTSDNGGFINEDKGRKVTDNTPLRSGKGSLYEGGTRIPLIIHYPGGAEKGAICNLPTISNDFFPTLCEIAGVDIFSSKTDGVSLLKLMRNPGAKLSREYLFWHYPHYYLTTTPVSAVRYNNWKLLRYYEDNKVELYNLQDDIGERINLAEINSDVTNKMIEKLDEWLQETKASFPTQNPKYITK